MSCRERKQTFSPLATHGRARVQLTDAKIRALKPKASRYLVSDEAGLSLDVLPSGKMSWLYRYRQGGKEEGDAGPYPALTLKAARAARI